MHALYLFGSRAKKTATEDSDIDVALELMLTDGKRNGALANFSEFFGDWKAQLGEAVHWTVSLIAIGPESDLDDEVRQTGVFLWRRS